MSIKYNDKLIAGKYKVQLITPADTVNSGTIKIATQQEVNKGIDNTTAVTPYYLATKQDKLVAGDNILLDENLIECTVYPDDVTIVQNEDGTITNIAQKTVNDTIKIDWVGTTAEYEAGVIDGSIEPHWYCYITDDEQYVDYENLMLADLTNIRQEGIETIDNIVTNNLQKADINLDNITEAGEQVIRDNAGIKFELFDSKLADHVLSYEESLGWGLQGTYVYKDAIAGERFGYPEFYAKCIEEFNNSNSTQEYYSSNVIKTGNIVDSRGVLSGFSTANYATLPNTFAPTSSDTWEMVVKHTVSSIGTLQTVFAPPTNGYSALVNITTAGKAIMYLSSNGTSWDLATDKTGITVFVANQTYYLRLIFDGAQYILSSSTDGDIWTQETVVTSTTPISPMAMVLGLRTSSPLLGTIDLNESYININGERWWSGANTYTSYNNKNGHKFYNIAEKDKIDELYSNFNRAWMYGVDTENERIFLPREKSRYLIDSKKATDEDPSWYNLYSDGWCEQGGVHESATVYLLKSYKDTNYNAIRNLAVTSSNTSNVQVSWFSRALSIVDKTTNSFTAGNDSSRGITKYMWRTSGYTNEVTDINKYICVGNIKSDTAWIDVVNQVKNGVKEIEIAREETLNDVETTKDEAIYEIRSNAEDLIKINRLKMFQPLLLDYVLPFKESKGLALQGTYVYKDAIAGSRYGYSTFYNQCVKEYNNPNNTYEVLQNNYEVVGSPTITEDGVVSGFSASNSINTGFILSDLYNKNWVMRTRTIFYALDDNYTLGSTLHVLYDGQQWLTKGNLGIVNRTGNIIFHAQTIDGPEGAKITIAQTETNLKEGDIVDLELSFNLTTYTLKAIINNSKTITKTWTPTTEDKNLLGTQSSNTIYINSRTGSGTLGNSNSLFDLKHFSITVDGEEVYRAVDCITTNPNGHKFYPIHTKSLIDERYTSTGRAWMYGVDTENERIFLPRNKYFATTGEVIGNGMALGLTNGTAEGGLLKISGAQLNYFASASGKPISSTPTATDSSTYDGVIGVTTDPTKSGIVLNPDKNMLLYICVGNTESEEALTNITEITTSENDTLPWGYHFYSGELLEAPIGYIESLGQWNDGSGVYEQFFSKAVNKLGEAFAGGYIKNHTEEYDDYDLVINQDEMTFRLPLLDGSEDLPSEKFENLTLQASDSEYIAPANGYFYLDKISASSTTGVGQGFKFQTESGQGNKFVAASGATPTEGMSQLIKKGETVSLWYTLSGATQKFGFYYAQGNGSLYFKVANAVQNLELLNAGEVLEAVNDVVPNNRTVWDGQWVQKHLVVFTAVKALGSYSYDLSSYLPNDGYVYEVLFNSYMNSGNTTYQTFGTVASPKDNLESCIACEVVSTSTGAVQPMQFILPIDTSRTVYMQITGAVIGTTSYLHATAYRRIGTNI